MIKVLGIKICTEKGHGRFEVKEGVLLENYGLKGDAYAHPGDREVCLMSKKTTDKLSDYSDGLCIERFVESILIDTDPDQISVNDVLTLGEAEVLITKKGKRCFSECQLIQRGQTCPLMDEPLFGKVLKTGRIWITD